jgi:wyosine [tRNA(Phe)-imidazoG37] synthetase (radical SAM superfamily)
MAHVFGPVPSRRLGLSLGVDLIPPKTCTFDCLYCQVGRTTLKRIEPEAFVPIKEVIRALKEKLKNVTADYVTFSGSGEPTLHSEIDQAIRFVKETTNMKVALLTNGSLFWREEVREKVLRADLIMPTLSTAFEETFRAIHRPHRDLRLSNIIEGLKRLHQVYKGQLFLEVVLLAGINETEREIQALKRVIDQIAPDRIQLNTVVRPPADSRALLLDRKRLEDIKNFLGAKAEIIAEVPPQRKVTPDDSLSVAILEIAKRRPVRASDISNVLNRSLREVEGQIKDLVMKGQLRYEVYRGEIYYST